MILLLRELDIRRRKQIELDRTEAEKKKTGGTVMEQESRIIALQGAVNVRELGGLPLKNGKTVKHKKLIRSGKLSALTPEDCRMLHDVWNVTAIADLRNGVEIAENPDLELEGAIYRHISLLSGYAEGVSREENGLSVMDRMLMTAKILASHGGAPEMLRRTYAGMAEDPYSINGIRTFFSMVLKQPEGAFLWHCTAGKDRTGVTAMLLLSALGAEMDVIREDYLLTNEQTRKFRENILDVQRNRGVDENLLREIDVFQSVDWTFMESFLAAVDRLHGGIDAFLKNQIGLTEEKRQLLLEKYTE